MTSYRQFAGINPGFSYRETNYTNYSALITGSNTALQYISMRPMTYSYYSEAWTCNAIGEDCTFLGRSDYTVTVTGTSYNYNCSGDTINSNTYTEYPVSEASGYLFSDGAVWTIDNFFSSSANQDFATSYGSYSEYSSAFGSSAKILASIDLNSLWTYTFRSYSANQIFSYRREGSLFSSSSYNTEWEAYVTSYCAGMSTIVSTGYTTGETITTGKISFTSPKSSILSTLGYSTITSVGFYLNPSINNSVSIYPSTTTGLNTEINFTFGDVTTYYSESIFDSIARSNFSGLYSYNNVISTSGRIPIGAYYNTIYMYDTCESVYSAPYMVGLGNTYLFSDIFNSVDGHSIVKGGAPENIIDSNYSSASSLIGDMYTSYTSIGIQKNVIDFYGGGEENYWSPAYAVNFPINLTKTVPMLTGKVCIPYSKLSNIITDNLYETYRIKVASTLNSLLFPEEYSSRERGFRGTVSADQIVFEIATLNVNDSLEMKKSIRLSSSTSNDAQFPLGGKNYFFPDAETIVEIPSGSYVITHNNETFKTNSPYLTTIKSSDIFSAEQLCAISIYGQDDIETNYPAAASENSIAIRHGLCNNEGSTFNFTNQFFDFNYNNIINASLAQTYYPLQAKNAFYGIKIR